MKRFLISVLVTVLLLVAVLGLAIALGGPDEPKPLASINDPFDHVDFSDLPVTRSFAARDGANLAFRSYPSPGTIRGSVVLIHGSSASSSLHVMAKGFAAAGYAVSALDVRGHGASGTKGQIAYLGQLEDDLVDFVQAVKPIQPATLVGFSSGGGFALRFAGSARQTLFANYLLLTPFLSQDAATERKDAGGWATVGVPRIVAISILNGLGVHAFDRLPVIKYALSQEAKKFLTPQYSFALAQNFRPLRDYQANIRAIHQPLAVVAGQNDEVFAADQFAGVFQAAGKNVPVTLLPGIDHIALTLDPAAIQAAVAAVESLDQRKAY